MKKISNKTLAISVVLSFAVSLFLILLWLEIIFPEFSLGPGYTGNIALIFSVVPTFLLQILLCRIEKYRLAPTGVIAFIAAGCGIGWALSSGWDSLGWIILLIMCIPPAVGVVAGYGYFRIFEKNKR